VTAGRRSASDPPPAEDVGGVILAGGLGRRLGGGNKGLRPIAGRSMLDHVIARLAPQCRRLVLNANEDPTRFAAFCLPVIADDVPGFAGPLAGILAGLDWAAAEVPAAAWMVSVPADTPFLPPDLVVRLMAARAGAGTDVACAASGGRRHPVIGLWPVAMRGALRSALVGEGLRKVGAFLVGRRVAVAEWPIEPRDPFFNVNSAADLAEAEELAQREAAPASAAPGTREASVSRP
jgi:molybdopterin-guanine dinucleotide biosynthesis protein A